MGHTLSIRKSDSIREDLEAMDDRIRQRAYELFLGHGFPEKDLDDWLSAEGELAWHPLIELREKDAEFVLNMAVPGVEPRAINVHVTPEDILVTAPQRQLREELGGTLHTSELRSGDLFRAIRLPRRIDPDTVRARVENGMLQLIASIASERPEEVPVSGRLMASAAA